MDIVIEVTVIEPYVLEVTFRDGVRRRVDIEPLLYGEMLEPLRDPRSCQHVGERLNHCPQFGSMLP